MIKVIDTLEQRGSNYGKFEYQAALSQGLKDCMRTHPNYKTLTPEKREALEMIQHKIARIINGDSNYIDSWHDVSGYASLIENLLNGNSV